MIADKVFALGELAGDGMQPSSQPCLSYVQYGMHIMGWSFMHVGSYNPWPAGQT